MEAKQLSDEDMEFLESISFFISCLATMRLEILEKGSSSLPAEAQALTLETAINTIKTNLNRIYGIEIQDAELPPV